MGCVPPAAEVGAMVIWARWGMEGARFHSESPSAFYNSGHAGCMSSETTPDKPSAISPRFPRVWLIFILVANKLGMVLHDQPVRRQEKFMSPSAYQSTSLWSKTRIGNQTIDSSRTSCRQPPRPLSKCKDNFGLILILCFHQEKSGGNRFGSLMIQVQQVIKCFQVLPKAPAAKKAVFLHQDSQPSYVQNEARLRG